MAPPLSTSIVIPPIVGLLVRVFTFFCLLISIIILATVSKDAIPYIYAYRYLLSCLVIGLVYTVVQVAFSVTHVTSGKRVVESLENFDFYPDLLFSNLMVSGASASFGFTVDVTHIGYEPSEMFFEKIYASTSLCLIAFVFAAISTSISYLNARRKSTS